MSKDKVTLSETSSTYKILITTPVINWSNRYTRQHFHWASSWRFCPWICVCLHSSFLRYSTCSHTVTLKPITGVIQGHRNWYGSIRHREIEFGVLCRAEWVYDGGGCGITYWPICIRNHSRWGMSIRRRYMSVSHSRNESYSQNHTAQTHQRCADCKTFVTGLADQTIVTSCAGGRHSIPPPPVTLTSSFNAPA